MQCLGIAHHNGIRHETDLLAEACNGFGGLGVVVNVYHSAYASLLGGDAEKAVPATIIHQYDLGGVVAVTAYHFVQQSVVCR